MRGAVALRVELSQFEEIPAGCIIKHGVCKLERWYANGAMPGRRKVKGWWLSVAGRGFADSVNNGHYGPR